MNISTGGGTLVHEMVHAFMHGNVPSCPVWINEGLASLFEQCALRDGHIIGRVNWRLTGLKEALAADEAPAWAHLAVMTDREFYQVGTAANLRHCALPAACGCRNAASCCASGRPGSPA